MNDIGYGEFCALRDYDDARDREENTVSQLEQADDRIYALEAQLTKLRELDVSINDYSAADGITPNKMRSYLAEHGWWYSNGQVAQLWVQGGFQALVPLNGEAADYNRRVLDLISVLADAEDRSEIAVMLDLAAADGEQ